MNNTDIKFLRRKDYVLLNQLGQGACGKTVILRDPEIAEDFVCKKYAPLGEKWRKVLFENFLREIKILHRLFHRNIVRVFNYYIYRDSCAGYILMELIQGEEIDEYIKSKPEDINSVFTQLISGFTHLEECKILHRDIRPTNILVDQSGVAKIIDFGFGKEISEEAEFDKSITLNWWCDLPDDFKEKKYNFSTEVYFVGKLIEKLIIETGVEHFKYRDLLAKMCQKDPSDRFSSFAEVSRAINKGKFVELEFKQGEIDAYRSFSAELHSAIRKIENDSKFKTNVEEIQTNLENAYKSCMLEELIPDAAVVTRCFLNGSYYYNKQSIYVSTLGRFVHLLKGCSVEKKNIVLSNIQTKLESIAKYSEPEITEDDVPF